MVHLFLRSDKMCSSIVRRTQSAVAAMSACVLMVGTAVAQTNSNLVNPGGIPAQIVPTYGEVGITWSGFSGGSNVTSGGGSGTSPSNTRVTNPGSYQPGSSTALNAMLATDYGSTAETVAQQQGVSVESVAAVGQAESGFRNVPTSNGSSSATGPWQFTTSTFQAVSNKYALGYTAADITNPQAQATEVSYLMYDNANAVSQVTGKPATTLQAYGGWVFGASPGAQIAAVAPDTPLNQIVSAQALANNGMSSWTVGQFRQVMTNRLGAAANQPVLTSS